MKIANINKLFHEEMVDFCKTSIQLTLIIMLGLLGVHFQYPQTNIVFQFGLSLLTIVSEYIWLFFKKIYFVCSKGNDTESKYAAKLYGIFSNIMSIISFMLFVFNVTFFIKLL